MSFASDQARAKRKAAEAAVRAEAKNLRKIHRHFDEVAGGAKARVTIILNNEKRRDEKKNHEKLTHAKPAPHSHRWHEDFPFRTPSRRPVPGPRSSTGMARRRQREGGPAWNFIRQTPNSPRR